MMGQVSLKRQRNSDR